MWQFDKFTNTFIPGTLPADGSKITACYDRLSQEDEQEGDSISIQNQRDFLRTYCEDHRFPNVRFFSEKSVIVGIKSRGLLRHKALLV